MQKACGRKSEIEIAREGSVGLKYCGEEDVDDAECPVSVEGLAVRHVRLDADVNLINADEMN